MKEKETITCELFFSLRVLFTIFYKFIALLSKIKEINTYLEIQYCKHRKLLVCDNNKHGLSTSVSLLMSCYIQCKFFRLARLTNAFVQCGLGVIILCQRFFCNAGMAILWRVSFQDLAWQGEYEQFWSTRALSSRFFHPLKGRINFFIYFSITEILHSRPENLKESQPKKPREIK